MPRPRSLEQGIEVCFNEAGLIQAQEGNEHNSHPGLQRLETRVGILCAYMI